MILYTLAAYWFAHLSGIPDYIITVAMRFNATPKVLWLLNKLSCVKCVCFWVGLIVTGNVLLACISSLIGMVFCLTVKRFLL